MQYRWTLKQKLEHIGKNPITVARGRTEDEETCLYEVSQYLSLYLKKSNRTILVVEKLKENN